MAERLRGLHSAVPTSGVELRQAGRVAHEHQAALEGLAAALQGGRQLRGHPQGVGLCQGVVLRPPKAPHQRKTIINVYDLHSQQFHAHCIPYQRRSPQSQRAGGPPSPAMQWRARSHAAMPAGCPSACVGTYYLHVLYRAAFGPCSLKDATQERLKLTSRTRMKRPVPARFTLWPARCQKERRCGCVALSIVGGPPSMTPLCAYGAWNDFLRPLRVSCTAECDFAEAFSYDASHQCSSGTAHIPLGVCA